MDITNYVSNIYFLEYLYKYYPTFWIKLLTLDKNTFDVAISILLRNKYTNAKHDINQAIQFLPYITYYTNIADELYNFIGENNYRRSAKIDPAIIKNFFETTNKERTGADEALIDNFFENVYSNVILSDNVLLYRMLDDTGIINYMLNIIPHFDYQGQVSDLLGFNYSGLKILSYVIDPTQNYATDIKESLCSDSFSVEKILYILQHSHSSPDDYPEVVSCILNSGQDSLKILPYVLDPVQNYTFFIEEYLSGGDSFSPEKIMYILQHSRVTPNDYIVILRYMLRDLYSSDDISYNFTDFLIDKIGPRNNTQLIRVELQSHFGLNLEKLVQFDTSAKNYTKDILNELAVNYNYDQIQYIIAQDQGNKDYYELIDNIITYNNWPVYNTLYENDITPIRVYKMPPEEYFRVLELVLMNSTANNYYYMLLYVQSIHNEFYITDDKQRIINLLRQYST